MGRFTYYASRPANFPPCYGFLSPKYSLRDPVIRFSGAAWNYATKARPGNMKSETERSLLGDLLEDAAARFDGLAHVVIPADDPSGIAEHENVSPREIRGGSPIHRFKAVSKKAIWHGRVAGNCC